MQNVYHEVKKKLLGLQMINKYDKLKLLNYSNYI